MADLAGAVRVRVAPGPLSLSDPDLGPVRPAPASRLRAAPGPLGPAIPSLTVPVRPSPAARLRRAPAPYVPTPTTNPYVPSLNVAGVDVSVALKVDGFPNATQMQCQPRLNDAGTASFTTLKPGPDEYQGIAFTVGGERVFSGHAVTIVDHELMPGEESAEDVDVTVSGQLVEFEQVVVMPDFGSKDPSILGAPIQDERSFDWSCRSVGDTTNDALPPLTFVPARSLDMPSSDLLGLFPLPDVWPDPAARWMWPVSPVDIAPAGHCYFRRNTGELPAGRYQFWAAAYDYAEVSVDGVLLLTCSTPGAAEHVELELTNRPHTVTIDGYNVYGRAGVAFTMLPVNDQGLYDAPRMHSESGWRTLPYPTRSLRYSPGAVMRLLRVEARSRHVMVSDWTFTFNQYLDSAGRPWPTGEVITVKVGATMLDVLKQLSEDRVDFFADPAGRVLHMWVKGQGTGASRPLLFDDAELQARDVQKDSR